MKPIYTLILCLFSFGITAQQTELIENEWFLEKLNINEEETLTPSGFTAILNVSNNFAEINHPDCELASSGAGLSAINNNSFTLSEDFVLLAGWNCPSSELETFVIMHFIVYNDSLEEPIDYEITTNNDVSSLIITNINGDQAFYNNTPPLSVNENIFQEISLYPNPVQDQLFFKTSISLQTATVYSLNGKLVSKYNISNLNTINTANLTHGLYFVIVEDKEENKITKKFVKN